MDVALASCKTLPEPDSDAAPLEQALAAAGIAAKTLAWDDPGAEFASARLTILRSTWNYSWVPGAFAQWLEQTARASALWNPLATVKWNMHKGYLLALRRAGVPTVPTRLVRRGDVTSIEAVARELGAEDVVVKPAVSAASRATVCIRKGDRVRGDAHLHAIAATEDVLVQPYLASVEGYGERALVWIDGEVTHAVRKSPRFLGDAESVSEAVPIAPEERELAMRAIQAAPSHPDGPLLYARVDVARGPDGAPLIMELELIEPSLFFTRSPLGLERYVSAIRRLLRRPSATVSP